MKPASFQYHAPHTLDDALSLLAQHGDEVKPLAGGQSLVPLLALRMSRFEHLVDLNGVSELNSITRSNGTVRVGAMTRQRTAERDPIVGDAVPLLARSLPLIGHFQIRNRGTIGGSLAHADPASELPAVAATLDATFDIAMESGTRRVAAADFFAGHFTTAIAEGELLVAVHFPVWGAGSGFAIREFARRHGDFAVAGATAAIHVNNDVIDRAAIAFFGMGATPMRARTAEAALVGMAARTVDATAIGELAVRDTEPGDDIHASATHRRHIATQLAADAIRSAITEAVGVSA